MRKTYFMLAAGAAFMAPWAVATAASEQERIEQLERQVDALTDAVESSDQSMGHHGGSGKTTVGGYGELHYNNLENDATGDDFEEVDLHRFIIFLGHEFNDDIRFFSELEVEHGFIEDENDGSGDTAPGEVAMEQAYLEFDLSDRQRVRAGLFLVPAGILNETHEPPTFYGVERNQVETEVIPSTWREAGVMLSGNLGASGWSYDVGLHSGLEAADGDIRGGRQSGGNADASELAYTGRIRYTGVPGLELSATLQRQGGLSQSDSTGAAEEATFGSAHARWRSGSFELTGLYAAWTLDGNGLSDAQEEQDGGYIEASYKFGNDVGVFARQSTVSTFDGDEFDRDRTSLGVNYYPHENVVVKFDIQQDDADDDADASDGFNLGIGYQF